MARPAHIKVETILDAARAVFLERGIRATTADVAERAGISEGSVFKKFNTKFELFSAAMQEPLSDATWLSGLGERVGAGEVRENLVELGLEILKFFQAKMPLIMMSWSNPLPDGVPPTFAGVNPPPARAARKLASFFRAEMKAGRMKKADAETVARTFLGALVHYVVFTMIMKSPGDRPPAAKTYVRNLVDLLFTGLEP